ncbi:MAG: helix-turn-helix domain-containing protein [Candidatus Altiarchaeota archaeon]|nr:helix-turn-helix domain-containing protein [Candidatus Altiarchaeota archaeon]
MADKYKILMILSFVYGGFLLIVYIATAYSSIWDNSIINIEQSEQGGFMLNRSRIPNNSMEETANNSTQNISIFNLDYPRTPFIRAPRTQDPLAVLTSPFLLFILFGGVMGIINGIAINSLTRREEIKKVKKDLSSRYLTKEEKEVITLLEKSAGELTQRNLTELTGYSRVKTHRIVQRLEEKKLVKKIPNGQTNRIILEKE